MPWLIVNLDLLTFNHSMIIAYIFSNIVKIKTFIKFLDNIHFISDKIQKADVLFLTLSTLQVHETTVILWRVYWNVYDNSLN